MLADNILILQLLFWPLTAIGAIAAAAACVKYEKSDKIGFITYVLVAITFLYFAWHLA